MTAPGKNASGWRLVYFVQWLITRLAPPLHSLQWKILALMLVVIFLPQVYFLWEVRRNIEYSHLRSTENGMIDTAMMVAEIIALKTPPEQLGKLDVVSEIHGKLFKRTPDLRVMVYDAGGLLLHDTGGEVPPGSESLESDVKRALQGKYGARWEHDPYRRVVVLYATVPVFEGKKVTGAVSVVKTTSEIRRSILRSLKDLAKPLLFALLLAVMASLILSSYLTRIVSDLANRAKRIAEGEQGIRLETWTKSELGDLARAVESMRQKLEGRAYIEDMASTLSHELKTPLSAIRGAAEVIEDSDSPQTRQRFLQNIRAETDRLAGIVDNLLALSRIESQPQEEFASCRIDQVAHEILPFYRERAEARGVTLEVNMVGTPGPVAVPADQLRRIVEVLLDNAIAFSPAGQKVYLEIEDVSIRVKDEGCGIEPELQAKIFERFFTTVNPLTGRRGTGLGLSILKSLVDRNHGEVSLKSNSGKGTEVTVKFTRFS